MTSPFELLMTPQERRGRWMFLILATIIMLDKVWGSGLTISGSVAHVNWFKTLLQPVGFASAASGTWSTRASAACSCMIIIILLLIICS
jgi:hypothetical protein